MSPHRLFGHSGGELVIGGVTATRLAARVGSTPFFAYDRKLITDRVAEVRTALPAEVELHYAVKANPMPAVLAHLRPRVDGFDVASARELRAALDTGVVPQRVSFAGPGKRDAELAQAVAAGVTIELESPGELDRVAAAGATVGVRPRVALRVNPDFAVRGSGMRMGGGPQQFGVDAEAAPAVLARIGAAGLDFQGFHVFAGSQNLHAAQLCAAQEATVDLVVRLADAAPSDVRWINLGGGFGIPYSARDSPLTLAPIGENLSKLLATRLRPRLGPASVVIELGRFLVGEAGVYLTRVVDRKVSRGTTYLVVDGGLHHQLAASGNLGQVIPRNYPIAVANRYDAEPAGPVNVAGCLCTPLDLLGRAVVLPDAQVGDLIAVFQAGAYGRSASPTAFLSHPEPVEVLV